MPSWVKTLIIIAVVVAVLLLLAMVLPTFIWAVQGV